MTDHALPTKGKAKKLLFVTGTRADFGKLEPLALAAQKEGFEISFFITGMHMMSRYGETRLEVKRFVGAEFKPT
jgi:UDP-N-acetylglucosamine 2-epimerase (hydrolysing)